MATDRDAGTRNALMAAAAAAAAVASKQSARTASCYC